MSVRIGDLFSVAGKTVLVTGGSRGLGEMMARGFVENGARVYVSSRKAAVCEAIAAELSANGTCVALPADLGRFEEIERIAAELAAREPKLHVLVNNAGANWGASFETFPESGWDKVLDLNLKTPFFLTQRLAPLLEAAASEFDPARVINIASIDGIGVPRLPNYSYSASKAALAHLTRHLAHDLASRNIAVNAIAPGFFPSKMTESVLADDSIRLQTPLQRLGTLEDVAGTVLYMSSRAGAFLCGSVVTVDGGLVDAR